MLKRSFAEYESQYTPQAYAATTQPDIARRLSEGQTWLALHGCDAVGTVSAAIEPRGVHIRGMAIVPEARGLGIADALLLQVEQFAREQGVPRMRLHTTPFLSRAIRCYERFGFARSQDPPSSLFGTPLFRMEKQL